MFLPPKDGKISIVMDGDLPKADYFTDHFSEKLSLGDGDIHTVVAGRMIGINENELRYLSEHNIHIHLYTENYHSSRSQLQEYYMTIFPNHFHVHKHVSPQRWCKEFSKYDAGWMHRTYSVNNGNLLLCTWDDLNIPARISTYMAAALPVLYSRNVGHTVAIEQIIDNLGIGLGFHDMEELVALLKDESSMSRARSNAMKHRLSFSFDNHLAELIYAFREIIKKK